MRIPETDPWKDEPTPADIERLARKLVEEMRTDPSPPPTTCSGMGVTDPEPEPKDEWEAFLAAPHTSAPMYTPVRAWVLGGGPAFAGLSATRHQRAPVAVAFELRIEGRSHPFIFTVPLVRAKQMIGYLARRDFLWPATFDDERTGRGYDWAPWAGELTPTLFTLPDMLGVNFHGHEGEVKPQTLNGLVEVAQSLADVARISGGLVRVR